MNTIQMRLKKIAMPRHSTVVVDAVELLVELGCMFEFFLQDCL